MSWQTYPSAGILLFVSAATELWALLLMYYGVYHRCRWRWTCTGYHMRVMSMAIGVPTFMMRITCAMAAYCASSICFAVTCIIIKTSQDLHIKDLDVKNVDYIISNMGWLVTCETVLAVTMYCITFNRLMRAAVLNAPIIMPNFDPWFQLYVRRGCVDMDVLIAATSTKLDRASIQAGRTDIQPNSDTFADIQNKNDAIADDVENHYNFVEETRAQALLNIYFRTRKLDAGTCESTSIQILALNLTVLIMTAFIASYSAASRGAIMEEMMTTIITTIYVSAGLGILICLLLFNMATVAIRLADKTLEEQDRMYVGHLGNELGHDSFTPSVSMHMGNFMHDNDAGASVGSWPSCNVWTGYVARFLDHLVDDVEQPLLNQNAA